MASMTDSDARAEYIAGLRALADVLEQNPHLVLPLAEHFSAFCSTREQLQDWMRVLPGEKRKSLNHALSHMTVGTYTGQFGPHGFLAWIERDTVCRRVVTGTRTVVKTVPAPDAPTVEVTETVEDVEWQCEPLLAEATS
jgi:hypothetical protein